MRSSTGWLQLLLVVAVTMGAPSLTAALTASVPPLDPLAPVVSMGEPPTWKPFAGGYYGLDP